MNLMITTTLALQWSREEAQYEVVTASFFRFRAGGFAFSSLFGLLSPTGC